MGRKEVTMDPQATWDLLLDAYQEQDWPLVTERAESLLGWLARGGFPPRLDQRQARLIVQMFCSQVLASIPQTDR
jgi:hypothetical protein